MLENLLTAKEVSERLNLNIFTVYRAALDRKVPSIKLGRCRRFLLSDIEKWVKKSRVEERGKGTA